MHMGTTKAADLSAYLRSLTSAFAVHWYILHFNAVARFLTENAGKMQVRVLPGHKPQ